MARHADQQRRDQRGAPHQPQRDQETKGDGQGTAEDILSTVPTKLTFKSFSWVVNVCPAPTQTFRNPHHHGKMNNWKILFGVERKR